MTKRTEFEHWKLEKREAVMAWVAGKLFNCKQTGLDGLLKRKMLSPAKPSKETRER